MGKFTTVDGPESSETEATVIFRDDLPKSNVGKVLRKDLRDEAQRAYLERKGAPKKGAPPQS